VAGVTGTTGVVVLGATGVTGVVEPEFPLGTTAGTCGALPHSLKP
jgi:hypothetical protein